MAVKEGAVHPAGPMVAPPTLPQPRKRRRGRRAGATALLTLLVAVGGFVAAGGQDTMRGLPLPGAKPSANSVFGELKDAGVPITDGVPKDSEFRQIVSRNRCAQSRSFVRTGGDTGWGLICVGLSQRGFQRMNSAFEEMPALVGPLYLDAADGDIVIFGMGWPGDASETMSRALKAKPGQYLTDLDS